MVNVCFITDDNYILPTMTAIRSISLFSGNSGTSVYVLSNNVSENKKKLILNLKTKNCSVQIIEIGDLIPDIECEHGYVTKTALAKFLLPDILTSDKVLYLDCDIIVKTDLSKFYQTDISNVYAAAVRDIEGELNGYGVKLGLKHYFNSGVMLLNLKKLREDDIKTKLINFKVSEIDKSFMDQNAFNAVFADNIEFSSLKFNYLLPNISRYDSLRISEFYGISTEELENIRKSVSIIHMTNVLKPWKDILSPTLGIYMQWLFRLPLSKFVICSIINLFRQNPKRFIKYFVLYCLFKKNSEELR